MSNFEDVAKGVELPDHGYWETTLIINGDVPDHRLNMEFLRLLDANNPRYTGWPVWMNTERWEESKRPKVRGNSYEALVVDTGDLWFSHIDFMRFDPTGKFYLRRAYQDDLAHPSRGPKPFTVLEFVLAILRAAEVIAVGLAFAKAMGCKPESNSLSYIFAWHRLEGRQLSSWANPARMIWGNKADRDEASSYIEVPLDMPLSRLGYLTKKAIDPLFDAFDENISQEVINDLSNRLVTRTLDR